MGYRKPLFFSRIVMLFSFSPPYLHHITPPPKRARLVAELKQLYQASNFKEILAKVESCLPKNAQGNFVTAQEKSDVVHELLAILKRNKRKIAIDPARREPQERLRAEFAASVGKLQPLMVRIAATDGLIDQIVYRLYGLTEEEIKILEGNE